MGYLQSGTRYCVRLLVKNPTLVQQVPSYQKVVNILLASREDGGIDLLFGTHCELEGTEPTVWESVTYRRTDLGKKFTKCKISTQFVQN